MDPPPPPPPPQLRVLDTVQLFAPPPHPRGESELSPSPLAPLSGLDADPNVLGVTFRSVRFFPPHPVSLDPLDTLQRAFAAALALFQQLAGSLRVLDRAAVVVVFSGSNAVPLVLAASDGLSVAEAVDADAPDSPLLDLLAPADVDAGVAGPALALQATRFACGGVALGMRVAHALCDGAGATRFLAAAARFARGEPVAPPVWARRELLGPRDPPRVVAPSFDTVLAPDYDAVGPYGGHGHEQQKLLKMCFHVSDVRVETLRARLSAEAAGVRLTTFEVLAAFIWRARVKANGTSPEETVKMVYSMNISKLLDPPLPEGYWGNVCVPVYVSLTSGDLLGRSLAETATLVRKSKREVDDEYVRSYVDFLELRRREGVTATAGRGGVSAFTDWRRLGHGEVDFGWGGPDAVLPLSWRILGSEEPCFLVPYGISDERRRRGFKVFVAVRETAVACFREEMEEILLLQQEERGNYSTAGKL